MTLQEQNQEKAAQSWFEKFKSYSPSMKLVSLLCIALSLWGIFYNLHIYSMFRIVMMSGHYYAVFVGLVLVLIFIIYPSGNKIKPLRWYDFILMGLSVLVTAFYGFRYTAVVVTGVGGAQPTQVDIFLGIIAVAVVLEAVRRTTGWAMVIVSLFFLFHGLYANIFPSFLVGPKVSLSRLITLVYMSTSGMFGFVMGIASTYIIAFATFGAFLICLGAADKFINLALALVGHVRGGAAKMAVISSAMLGTLTGDPISNVGISGSFSLPMMKKMGFKPEFAAAVETTASVGGVIMPPMMGAIIFFMVELTGISYAMIVKAAIFPAILYFIAIYTQIGLYSRRNNLSGLPASEIPGKLKTLYESKFLLVIFGLLVYFLVILFIFPVKAAYYAVGCMIVLFIFDRHSKVSVDRILEGFEIAGRFVIKVTPLIASAGIILASLSVTGTGIRISQRLLDIAGGNLLILIIMTAVLCYLLGLGVSAMLAYVLLGTLIAPALVKFGVPPIAAHFFIIYMGLAGFFTPPYAVVALTASALAGSNFYKTCWQSMKLAFVAYLVPITIILDPVLLLEDFVWLRFVFRFVVALIAIYFASAGLEGYFHKRILSWWERIIFSIGGITLFIIDPFCLYLGGALCILALSIYCIKYLKSSGLKTEIFS